jgi:hypothetical protein
MFGSRTRPLKVGVSAEAGGMMSRTVVVSGSLEVESFLGALVRSLVFNTQKRFVKERKLIWEIDSPLISKKRISTPSFGNPDSFPACTQGQGAF